MKKFYCFTVQSDISLEDAWQELEEAGVELAYGSDEEDLKLLYGYTEDEKVIKHLPSILSYQLTQLPPIDWEAQWAQHGWDFYDGAVHVNLSEFGSKDQILTLKPGPGFGDLSHPTTRLTLNLMSQQIDHQCVVDIGCGSGILTVAAVAMGAQNAYGIDIDPEAVEHSKINAALNKMEKKCRFCLPEEFHLPSQSIPILILMNMISSEQLVAWESLPALHQISSRWITSGIPLEEKEMYLKKVYQRGWKLIEEKEEEGWYAFIFTQF